MYIGEHLHISPLRYSNQMPKSPQNEISQPTLANNLYQQIIDKNNYFLNSNLSSFNANNKRISTNSSFDNDNNSTLFTSNAFNIQISSLESKNQGNFEIYSDIENQNATISNKINDINQSIQQLRSEIEKISSYQMNSILQPFSNKNKTHRNEIESFFTNFQSSRIQLLYKNLKEFSSSLFIFNDKFQMISNNFTKTDFPSLRRDINKILNMTKINSNQMDKNENILDQRIIKEYIKIDKIFEEINSKTSKNFDFFQNNINGQFISITNEISDILKSTSNDRQKITLSYQHQIEGIQNNVKNSLIQIQSNLKNFQKENSLILNDLKNSIARSLNLSQDESSQLILNLNNSYDNFVDDSSNNFDLFQGEITQTINSIRKKNENENSSILTVIESESQIQKEFLNETNDKISKFLFALNDQLELNLKKCQQNSIENIENGIQYFQELFEGKIKPSLIPLKEIESKLDRVEKRIVDCENSLYDTVTKMKVNINQTNDKINDITKSLDNTRNHQKERLNLIESDLRRIEVERNILANDKRLISVEYIEKVGLKFSEELDKKAIQLEYKFDQLKHFIQNIDPFNPNSSYYRENKNKKEEEINDANQTKNFNEINKNSNSNSDKNESENNYSSNSNNKDINNNRVFSASQLYSDQYDYYSSSKNESEETEENYSTNTLTENPKNNQIQAKILDPNQQESKSQNENWDDFSNSEADDEETEEFTFNNKSLNNSLKKS